MAGSTLEPDNDIVDVVDSGAEVSATEKVLLSRPQRTVRTRLVMMFSLFAIGSVVITAAMWVLVSRIDHKIAFIGVADQLNYEILQARRFEKNYLLYGGDLEHVDYHIDAAHAAMERSMDELAASVSGDCLEYLEVNLWRYRELIGMLRRLDDTDADGSETSREKTQAELRECGSHLVDCGQKVAAREREYVRRMLTVSRVIPVIYLLSVIVLSIYAAHFLRRHIMQRLELLMAAARRIGAGDFSPILPIRKHRDEFTNLAVAINRMTNELERRQEFLLQSQKLRAVGSLTAGVAHELNNPINNIMLTAAVLSEEFDELPPAEQQELIGDVLEQAERARRIVRNLLDFARESEISSERLQIGEAVCSAIDIAGNQLKLAGVKVVLDISDDLPEVEGDRQYLSQVFLNLILNAVEAMTEGGTLSIKSDLSGETGFLAVHVTDTGSGMTPRVQKAVFDPFFTTKATGSGTGLGLSVSLGIVHKHGGEIKVRSKPGEGTTFTVILPVAQQGAPSPE